LYAAAASEKIDVGARRSDVQSSLINGVDRRVKI